MKDTIVSERVDNGTRNEEALRQIKAPLSLTLPRKPRTLDDMTPEDIDDMLSSSYAQSMAGEGRPFEEVFDELNVELAKTRA